MSSPAPTRRVLWLRSLPVFAAAVLIQVTVFDRLDPDGIVRIDLPLLFVTALAMRVAFDDAALLGFVAGTAVDLFNVGPFGRHSLIYAILGFTIAVLTQRLGGVDARPRAGTWVRAHGGALERLIWRTLVAGTATAATGVGLLAVRAAVQVELPTVAAVSAAQPLAGLTGAVLGIHLVASTAGALGLAGEPHRSTLAHRARLRRGGDAFVGSLPLARRS